MKWRSAVLLGTIYLLLLLFVLYPIVSVLLKSLSVAGQLSSANYVALLTQPYLARTIANSLLMAGGSSLLSTLLGLVLALAVFKTVLPLRRIFALAAVLPMIIPGFVNTVAYIFLFGRNGLLTYRLLNITWDIYSWRSVLILQTLGLTTTTFLLVSAVLAGVDGEAEDAARNLGASEWGVLTTVTLPLIRPGLLGALLLAFLRSMADFGTPFIVGGRFNTLATASYSQLVGTYNMEMASTLSTVLLALSALVFWLYSRTQATDAGVQRLGEGGQARPLALGRPVLAVMWAVGILFSALVFLMLSSVVLAAFTKHLGGNFALTLEHFAILPQRGWNSTRNTLTFAAVTAVLVSLSGIVIAYLVTRMQFRGRAVMDALATVPFAIPGTVMGVGFALAFSRPPLVLSGTWAVVAACTVVRELPLGLRAASGVLLQQDRSLEEASANLGASRFETFWRVVVPLARPALVVSSLYAFVSTVQTLGAIIFLITPSTKLLSVDVFEATVRVDIGAAAAFSMVMIGISALGVAVIYWLSMREVTRSWLNRVLTGGLPR